MNHSNSSLHYNILGLSRGKKDENQEKKEQKKYIKWKKCKILE